MANITKLNVMLTASTKGLSAGISKAQGMLKSLSASARRMQSNFGKAFTGIGNIASRAFTGISSAVTIATRAFVGISTAATAAGASLAYLTKKSIDAVGDQNDFAKSLGLTYNGLRKIQKAAALSGVDLETTNVALMKMSDVLGTAFGGNNSAIAAFENIGLSVDKLKSMNPEQQFIAIAKAINKIQDPSQKIAAARDIFGRSGGMLISFFSNVEQDIYNAGTALDLFGISLSQLDVNNIDDAGDAMGEFAFILEGIGNQLAKNVAPYITQAMNDTQKWIKSMGGIDAIVNGSLYRLGEALSWILDKTVYIQAAWRELKDIVGAVVMVFDMLPKVVQDALKFIAKGGATGFAADKVAGGIKSDIQGHADQINKEGSGAAGFRDRVGAWGRGAQDAAAQSAQERVQSDHDQRKRDRIQREREQQMAGIQAQREGQAPELSPSQQRAAEIIQGAQRRGVMPSGPLQQGRGPRERNYWERNNIPDPRQPAQMNATPGAMQGPAQNTSSEDTNLLRQIASNTGKNTIAYAG